MDQSQYYATMEAKLAASEATLSQVIQRLSDLEEASGPGTVPSVSDVQTLRIANENTWILLTATIVFLMQYGFALLESGMCRKNNTTATYTKNILDATLGSLVALGFGYHIAYSESPMTAVVGSSVDMIESVRVSSAFFHHLVFQATSATIVSGAMAERTTIFAYCILTCFISGIPFSLAVRWTWGGGWLDQMGFVDFAGGAVVHLVGGACAIAGVYIVGEREYAFDRTGLHHINIPACHRCHFPNQLPLFALVLHRGRYDPRRFYEFMPHDVSSVMSGSLVLWVGWYGFNMGSVSSLGSVHAAHQAANAAVTTTVAAAAGAVTAVLFAWSRSVAIGSKGRTVDAIALSNGLLSGLVSITAGADAVYVIDAIWIGIGSGFAYMICSAISESCHLDDVVEAGAVHAGCGYWSVLACGLFHPTEGLFYTGKWWFLFVQFFGATAIALLAFFLTLVIAYWLRRLDYLRVELEEEEKGLDHKFGLAASAFHLQRAQRIREASAVIRDTGGTVPELIEALQSVKHQYLLPFSPQASDKVIEGQVIDVLSRLTTIFEGEDAEIEKTKVADENGAHMRIKWLAYMSHHKEDGGDAARVFVDTARRVFGLEDDDDSANDLIYLDKDSLSDLNRILDYVNDSGNFILMVTRQALERPSVLAELVRAYRSKKPLLVVTTIWPGDESSAQGRSFKFPQHLDTAIDEWQEYYYEARQREKLLEATEQESGWFSKLVASSVFLSLVSQLIREMNQERPSNTSSWEQQRWNLIGETIASSVKRINNDICTPLHNKLSAVLSYFKEPRQPAFQSLEA